MEPDHSSSWKSEVFGSQQVGKPFSPRNYNKHDGLSASLPLGIAKGAACLGLLGLGKEGQCMVVDAKRVAVVAAA